MPAITFIGEVEFSDELGERFASFDDLPLEDLVQKLAKRFTGEIEIMPYQKEAGPLQIAISVYLSSDRRKHGRVIAILVKQDYPRTLKELESVVKTARKRIKLLGTRVPNISRTSITRAEKSIENLHTAVIRAQAR